MNSKRLLAIGGLVLLVGASPSVVGAGEKDGGGHSQECAMHQKSTEHYLRHLLMHAQEIGLTADQVSKLKAIQLDLARTRVKTEADIEVSELERAALVEDEKADLSAIETKVKESEMLEVGLRMAAIKAKRDAVSLLTPEQREKEKAEREKMMKEMGGMMGKGMMGGKSGQEDQSPDQPKKEEHQY